MSSEWVVGMCGCLTDTRTCLDHLFCTPCMMSRHMMANDGWQDTFNIPICCSASCFGPYVLLVIRRKIVDKYHINEGCCNSFCKCCLCGPLLTCQHHYELTDRGLWPGYTLCVPQSGNNSVSVFDNIRERKCNIMQREWEKERKRTVMQVGRTPSKRKKERTREESPAVEEDPAPQGRIRQQEELPQHSDTSPQGQIPTPRQHDTIQIPYGPPAVTHPPYDQGTSTGMTYQV